MDSTDFIETIGNTEFEFRMMLIRIDAIGNADTAHNAIFRYGATPTYISAAAADMYAISETSLFKLLDQADAAYDAHPSATGTTADFDM